MLSCCAGLICTGTEMIFQAANIQQPIVIEKCCRQPSVVSGVQLTSISADNLGIALTLAKRDLRWQRLQVELNAAGLDNEATHIRRLRKDLPSKRPKKPTALSNKKSIKGTKNQAIVVKVPTAHPVSTSDAVSPPSHDRPPAIASISQMDQVAKLQNQVIECLERIKKLETGTPSLVLDDEPEWRKALRAREEAARMARSVYALRQQLHGIQEELRSYKHSKKSKTATHLTNTYRSAAKALQSFTDRLPYVDPKKGLPPVYYELAALIRELSACCIRLDVADPMTVDQINQMVSETESRFPLQTTPLTNNTDPSYEKDPALPARSVTKSPAKVLQTESNTKSFHECDQIGKEISFLERSPDRRALLKQGIHAMLSGSHEKFVRPSNPNGPRLFPRAHRQRGFIVPVKTKTLSTHGHRAFSVKRSGKSRKNRFDRQTVSSKLQQSPPRHGHVRPKSILKQQHPTSPVRLCAQYGEENNSISDSESSVGSFSSFSDHPPQNDEIHTDSGLLTEQTILPDNTRGKRHFKLPEYFNTSPSQSDEPSSRSHSVSTQVVRVLEPLLHKAAEISRQLNKTKRHLNKVERVRKTIAASESVSTCRSNDTSSSNANTLDKFNQNRTSRIASSLIDRETFTNMMNRLTEIEHEYEVIRDRWTPKLFETSGAEYFADIPVESLPSHSRPGHDGNVKTLFSENSPVVIRQDDNVRFVWFSNIQVLKDPVVVGKLADTKAIGEVRALDDLYSVLNSDPDRATYGVSHIEKANEQEAIECLLISDELFRSLDLVKRKHYIALVEEVKRYGGQVKIFSSLHVSGEQLGQLGGVAAILRFPIPESESEHESDGETSEIIDQSGAGEATALN